MEFTLHWNTVSLDSKDIPLKDPSESSTTVLLMTILGNINKARINNNWSQTDYANYLGIPPRVVLGLTSRVLSLSDLTLKEFVALVEDCGMRVQLI